MKRQMTVISRFEEGETISIPTEVLNKLRFTGEIKQLCTTCHAVGTWHFDKAPLSTKLKCQLGCDLGSILNAIAEKHNFFHDYSNAEAERALRNECGISEVQS